ncbi:MAG: PGF-pre-PGF domain-containing protein, partial [Methanomicrobiales archaeon]|nr:PGF-pre-PGF domain-containing protein [Methanomicrobiales archaeon]
YAPFTNVDTDDILSARAVAILYSAGDAGKSKFFFNDQEYAGFWTDYQADPQLGFSVYDVTGALQDGANEARLQSYDPGTSGDNMYAATVILVVTSLPQGDQTTDVSLEIPGCNVTTGDDGKSRVRIDISGAQVAGTTITIPQEAYTLTIETDEVPAKDEGGTITGTVTKIRLDTKPIVTKLDTVGAVNASISASLTHLPAEASLTTTVSQDVAPDARSAFQLAASDSGLNLIDVAYTLSIVRTKLENTRDIADATIRMSVSPGWVADHAGDASMVRIIRFADDGTHEILTTRLTGTDASGNLIFEANSPNGFSVFGLASVSAPSQPTQSRSSSGGGSGTLTSVGAASNLKVGDRAVISMDRTAVSAITFTAKNPIKDVMVTMAKGSLPRDAKPPAGTVYQYIEATLYRAAEEDLSTVQFRFAVPTDWLAAQSCTKDGVEFFRLTDDGWQEVSIEVLGEENGNAIFTANPEGFSLFAITATGKSPGATEPTQESTGTVTTPPADVTTPPAGTTTPTTPPPTPFPAWVAVMALGVSLLLVRRRA